MSLESATAFLRDHIDQAMVAEARATRDPATHLKQAASAKGLEFTREDLQAAAAGLAAHRDEMSEEQMSEEQLESVAGGVPESAPMGVQWADLADLIG